MTRGRVQLLTLCHTPRTIACQRQLHSHFWTSSGELFIPCHIGQLFETVGPSFQQRPPSAADNPLKTRHVSPSDTVVISMEKQNCYRYVAASVRRPRSGICSAR